MIIGGVMTMVLGLASVPAEASTPARVVPVNGKWAGLAVNATCASLPAVDTSDNGLPSGTCADADILQEDEDVLFTLRSRRITSMAFNISVQCRASDVPDWTPRTMTYRSAGGFSYVGLNGSTQIPASGLLRIEFPVEGSPMLYPDGTVKVTFDYRRGPKPKVAIYYKGQDIDTGITTTCVSSQNEPSVFAVQPLGR
jgi:hypothetical protein